MPKQGSAPPTIDLPRKTCTALRPLLLPMLLGAALLGASCGTGRADSIETAEATETRSGDGVLDCRDGLVPSSVAIAVDGESDQAVAAVALTEFLDGGARLTALPPDDSWTAVSDGSDVAMVYPTLLADGRWQVDAVITCGPAPPPTPEPNGAIDCEGDETWGVTGEITADADGHPNAELALQETLQRFVEQFGGEIQMVIGSEPEEGTELGQASLVIDGKEVVVALAIEFRQGRWAVSGYQGCGGYRLE